MHCVSVRCCIVLTVVSWEGWCTVSVCVVVDCSILGGLVHCVSVCCCIVLTVVFWEGWCTVSVCGTTSQSL